MVKYLQQSPVTLRTIDNSPYLMVYNFIPQELTKINFLEQYARLI